MEEPEDWKLLLASARQEISTLEADSRFKPTDGKRGEALHQHVLDLIGAAERRMTLEPSEDAPQSVKESFGRSLRESIMVLRAAHAAMPWLAAIDTPSINLGSLYLAEECAELIVSRDVDLAVLPDAEFMYSTISWPFRKGIGKTPGFQPKTKRRPIVLNYPLRDSDRLLLHALFAHELGHSSVDEHGFALAVEEALDEDSEFTQALEAVVKAMREGKWSATSESTITGTLRGWLRCWVEELLCDHLALAAMGPAYLWAFAGFVLPLSHADASPRYPPNTLRVQLALQLLSRTEWSDYMARVAPGITSWLAGTALKAGDPLPPPFDFLAEQVRRRNDLLQDITLTKLEASVLAAGTAVDEAAEAAQLLSRLILPMGEAGPLPVRSIVLGGWQEAFRRHGDEPGGLVSALDDPELQDLLGKAIEMSAVVTAWEEQ